MRPLDAEIVRRTRDVLHVLFSMGLRAHVSGMEAEAVECQTPPMRREVAEGLQEDLLRLGQGKAPQRLIDALGGRVPPGSGPIPEGWSMRVVLVDLEGGEVRLTVTMTRKAATP